MNNKYKDTLKIFISAFETDTNESMNDFEQESFGDMGEFAEIAMEDFYEDMYGG